MRQGQSLSNVWRAMLNRWRRQLGFPPPPLACGPRRSVPLPNAGHEPLPEAGATQLGSDKARSQQARLLIGRVAGRDCSRPAPSERHVQVSLHAAQAWQTPRAPVGECPSQCRHCRPLPSLLRRAAKVSGDARPEGRQRAFARGHVARGRTPSPSSYRMAFASSLLPCPHAYQLALRLAFPCGRRTGLPWAVSVTPHGVGARAPPVVVLPMTRNGRILGPTTVPCWPKPCSIFGLFFLTRCIARSPGSALPSILAPSPSRC